MFIIMKRVFNIIHKFLVRFRYPVSLPEDIALALGIEASNLLTFEEFVSRLISPGCRPTRLTKFMPREKAEAAFQGALRKEHFKKNSLFFYYFNEGWLEFILLFDEDSRLRRIYLQHKKFAKDEGVEIQLSIDQTS